MGRDVIINAAKTSMSSKLLSSESSFFSEMVVNAINHVRTSEGKYPVKAVRILKCHGQSTRESMHINGYALEGSRSA